MLRCRPQPVLNGLAMPAFAAHSGDFQLRARKQLNVGAVFALSVSPAHAQGQVLPPAIL